MGDIKDKLIEKAIGEWEFFGRCTRSLSNAWHVVSDESDEPYKTHINRYWVSVGQPTWNGATDEPWSAAFISWCFKEAGAGAAFRGSAKHSIYIDRIRRDTAADAKLSLRDPGLVAVERGDLIWNVRGANPVATTYAKAVERLKAGDFFISHVDIVVEVRAGSCDSIGGNVSNRTPGGSVTRSTWKLAADGKLADPRKTWIGVVKNSL